MHANGVPACCEKFERHSSKMYGLFGNFVHRIYKHWAADDFRR